MTCPHTRYTLTDDRFTCRDCGWSCEKPASPGPAGWIELARRILKEKP